MPKAKLKIQKTDLKKLKVAANFSGVKLGEALPVGNNVITEINFRTASDLVEMGRLIETVTGLELDNAEVATPAPTKVVAKK
jgi:hypothetical protein